MIQSSKEIVSAHKPERDPKLAGGGRLKARCRLRAEINVKGARCLIRKVFRTTQNPHRLGIIGTQPQVANLGIVPLVSSADRQSLPCQSRRGCLVFEALDGRGLSGIIASCLQFTPSGPGYTRFWISGNGQLNQKPLKVL